MTQEPGEAARKRLDQWLMSASASRATPAHPLSVHIDEVIDGLHDKSLWVKRGLELLGAAVHTPWLPKGCVICLVLHLDPGVSLIGISTDNPGMQWTDWLSMTPPELEFIHAEDFGEYASLFQTVGTEVGILSVGGTRASVYLTELIERFGDETERVRHIWCVASGG